MNKTKKLALVEVFFSIQGEGYNSGRQAVFVRLAGCNLACHFAEDAICDTPYMKAELKVTVAELFDTIVLPEWGRPDMTGSSKEAPMFIITGGEPTMAPLFDDLVHRAVSEGYYVAIETNGTKFREGLRWVHWRSVSPKEEVPQGSGFALHNSNPQSPKMHPDVQEMLSHPRYPGEYRYVISGADDPIPPMLPATRHYLSPAVLSDGTGLEWKNGFPGFAPGALERCIEIVQQFPTWRLSIQQHKLWGVR